MNVRHLVLILACAPLGTATLGGCEQAATQAPRDVEVRVEGMVCESCESTIQTALGALDGVLSCRASHAESKVVVRYEPARTDPEALVAAIRAAGYTVPDSP